MPEVSRTFNRYITPMLVIAIGAFTVSCGSEKESQETSHNSSIANRIDIDVSNLKKTHISYHTNGTRTYIVKTGYELSDGRVTDVCGAEGPASTIGYHGSRIIAVNDTLPPDVCADGKITPPDFIK